MNTSTFLTVCLETLSSFSREFSEEEVRQVVHSGKLPAVIERLWEFTGYFYKWPAALLARFDLPSSAKVILSINLKDELGADGAAAHTVLFSNMAWSLGVALPVTPKHGTLIRQALSNAISLDCPKALGQFFANEATPKWRGFMEALQDCPGVDLEFFRVHANEERHYLGLIDSFSIEHLPTFWIGIIEYAKLRASFMDGLRDMLQQ